MWYNLCNMITCSINGCEKPSHAKSFCSAHYSRWYRYGDPLKDNKTPTPEKDEERFWSKVDRSGPIPDIHPDLIKGRCWQWIGTTTNSGRKGPTTWEYGIFGVGPASNHRKYRAHRYAYELLVAPIPNGMQIDHLCKNTLCVNPSHLEPVTNKENTARGRAAEVNRAIQLAKTHCKRGHPLSGENLIIYPSTGQRVCRTCRNMRALERYRQLRATQGIECD